MKKILVGISGASGAPIAIRLLKRLREMADVETHLIMTKGAELTIVQETDCTVEQVKALADEVDFKLGEKGEEPKSIDGKASGNWIVLDYIDVVFHVFYKETRDFYDLERLWQDAEEVDVKQFLD